MIDYASTPTGQTEIGDLADKVGLANTNNDPHWLAYEGFLRVVMARGEAQKNKIKEEQHEAKKAKEAEKQTPAPDEFDLREAIRQSFV